MHIHIPDGIFPAWLWISGIILLLPLLTLAIYFVKKDKKKLVITSAITALMLIVFSIEIFGFHLNFTALSGIILGPWWSLLSITIVNIFLALFGHGGITVTPINIIINWVESLVAYAFFALVISKFKNSNAKSVLSSITVFISLAVSFSLFLGIIYLTGINLGLQLEEEIGDLQTTNYVPLKEFAIISFIPTLISGIIESILTYFIVVFIIKVRPKMIL